MADEYIDLTLIECNRQSADTKDDSNNAVWTNTLGNTFHMSAGDKVSMYSGFINERGSGQLGSIEFKGKDLPEPEITNVTNSIKTQSFNASTKQFELVEENCSNISHQFLPRDNFSEITISFYKTMDLMSYVQLPRRFIPDMGAGGDTTENYLKTDKIGFGRVLREPYTIVGEQQNTFGYVIDDYFPFCDYYADGHQNASVDMFKLRNDNSRMTIFKQHRTINDVSKVGTYKIPFTVVEHVPGSIHMIIKLILPFPYSLHHKIVGEYSNNDLDNERITDKIASPLFYIEPNSFMKNTETLYISNGPYFNRKNFFANIYSTGTRDLYRVTVSTEIVAPIPANTVLNLIPKDNNFPPYYANDPEYITYVPYRKNIPLETPVGYSSAEFVSNELSRQIQKTTDIKTDEVYHTFGPTNSTKVSVTKDYDSNTYQLFEGTNETIFTETNANKVVSVTEVTATEEPTNASVTDPRYEYEAPFNASTALYYRQFKYIGIKRPEIYETGTQLNSIFGLELNNLIGVPITQEKSKTEGLRIQMEYTRENCIKIKNFVEAQSKYPELFSRENIYNLASPADNVYTNASHEPFVNFDNARFMHINQLAGNFATNIRGNDINTAFIVNGSWNNGNLIVAPTMLGSSYYGTVGHIAMNGSTVGVGNRGTDAFAQSIPFFFKYDASQKDKFYDFEEFRSGYNSREDKANKLTFGCIVRDADFIVLFPNKILDGNGSGVGLPSQLFDVTQRGGPLNRYQKLGFDHHWNAWSTSAVMLHCGFAKKTEPHDAVFEQRNDIVSSPFTDQVSTNNLNQMETELVSKLYLGAPKAQLLYSEGRFAFSLLHNALNKGYFNASEESAEANDAATDVYKINPRQEYSNLTPTQMPYSKFEEYTSIPNQTTQNFNQNQEPYAIYDSHSGIFIEDFNIREDSWDKCLFNTLGFTYEQLHGNSVRNDRIDENNRSFISTITTNADINSVNTKSWNQNFYGSPMFDDQIVRNITNKTLARTILPEIVQPCVSVTIIATKYPININRGYYAIRSDIIPNTAFIGGKTSDSNLPVIAIASKESPQGDFFFGTESDLEFMITKPTVLSSVRVSIHDPDGSYSNVSPNSSIVFKIQRLRKVSFNVAQEIQQKFADEKKKGKQ